MRRWFFQRLEQRVECFPGQHVHLIDDEDTIGSMGRSVLNMLDQTADIIDSTVRCTVHLGDVGILASEDLLAGGTLVAGHCIFALRALQRSRKDSCHRSLADPPWPAEEVGMSEALLQDRLTQHLRHRLLPHHLFESSRTIATGNHLVAIASAVRRLRTRG